MTRVLVTGAKGQLALTIKELFSENEDDITFTFVSKSELDITNRKQVYAIFKANSFDFCVNCAAYTNVEQAEITPDIVFKVNAEGVKNLTEACKESKTVLVHISTDYVFDGEKTRPYLEGDDTNPINQYGKSKLEGEKNVFDILEKHFIIRVSWLYSVYGKNFVKTILEKIKKHEKLSVVSTQKGTPTSCIELSKFIYFLIKNQIQEYGLYHYSPEGEATWFDLALEIASYYSNYNETNLTATRTYKTLAKRPKYSVLDNSKRKGIYPLTIHWEETLKQTLVRLLD